jgi:hypothetical protein
MGEGGNQLGKWNLVFPDNDLSVVAISISETLAKEG